MKKTPLLTVAVMVVVAVGLLIANQRVIGEDNATPAASTKTTTAGPSAATGTPFPKSADFAGTITTASPQIALSIAVDNNKAVVYACDGNTVETWLRGSAANGTLDLKAQSGATLTGKFDGTNVVGTLKIGGKSYDFTAEPVSEPAGIYVYKAADGTRISWVVTGDGTSTGVLRAVDGTTSPGPPLDTSTVTAEIAGETVNATRVEGDDDN